MSRFDWPVPVLAAAALAALLPACGNSQEVSVSGSPAGGIEEESAVGEIEAVAARFERVVGEGDSRAFCRLLAPSAVQRLGRGETDGKRACLAVWGPDRNPFFGNERTHDLKVRSISLQGTYAAVELANGGKLAFSREAGRWYVNLAPGYDIGARR